VSALPEYAASVAKRIPPHLLVAASAWAGRIVSAIAGLLSIRMLLQLLGTELYAVYAILGGLQGWYMLSDAGIGSSLQNFISERRAHNQPYNDLLASTAVVATILMFVSLLLLFLITPLLAPLILRGFPFLSSLEKSESFILVGSISIMGCTGNIIYKAWYAEHKGYLSNIIPALAALTSLAGIGFVANFVTTQLLYWSLFAVFAPPALFPLIAYLGKLVKTVESFPPLTFELLWPVLRRGLKFWLFAIMAAGVLQIDYIVISQFLSAKQIVAYNLATKIFALVFFVYTALLSAIWPVCAEAIARNTWDVVVRYLKKYILLGALLVAGVTLLLAFFMPVVVDVLSPKEQVVVPVTFIILLGCYQIMRVWTDMFGMILQSMSYLRPFLLVIPVQVGINMLFQWLWVPEYGLNGVVMGLMLSFLLTVSWALPYSFYLRMNTRLK
jgi:O-antigen/teichoic acid export membrane protein